MRKRKTPKATNPAIRNIQLVIDSEVIERCGGWQNVIYAFGGYIYHEKPKGSIHEAFKAFREIYVDWLDHIREKDPTFKLPMSPDDLTPDLDSMTDDEFEQWISENCKVNQEFIDMGYFVQDTSFGVRPDGSIGEINKIRVTQKGLLWLKDLIKQGKGPSNASHQ